MAEGEPPQKRARVVSSPKKCLSGCKIFVPSKGIDHAQTKLATWKKSVPARGGALVVEADGTADAAPSSPSHIIVPASGPASLPAQLRPGAPGTEALCFVREEWLGSSIAKARRLPEAEFVAAPQQPQVALPPGAPPLPAVAAGMDLDDRGTWMAAWLGERWRPECAGMGPLELMLHACFDTARSERIGNEPAALAFKQLAKYERALAGDKVQERALAGGWQVRRTRTQARARALDKVPDARPSNRAAVHWPLPTRAWLSGAVSCRLPARDPVALPLPFVAARASTTRRWCTRRRPPRCAPVPTACARPSCQGSCRLWGWPLLGSSNEILESGTCTELELFRANKPVKNSGGQLRPGTEGAGTRLELTRLPGVGRGTAREWWAAGLRNYEEVLQAAERGQLSRQPTIQQLFSLRHSAKLLEGITGAEMSEMHGAVAEALAAASGTSTGWRIDTVGGTARERRPPGGAHSGGPTSTSDGVLHHDADFLCSHDSIALDKGLIDRVRAHMMRRGHLLPETEAMCQAQRGVSNAELEANVLQHINDKQWQPRDLLDHLFGIFRTHAGKHRRIDVVLATPQRHPYAIVSWIGSMMLNRFLRRHSADLGMHVNAHGLFRVVGGALRRVPEQAPPTARRGEGEAAHPERPLPAGWPRDGAGRPRGAQSEQDVWALFELPYLEPYERE